MLHVCRNNEKKIGVKPGDSRNETGQQPERNRAATGMKPGSNRNEAGQHPEWARSWLGVARSSWAPLGAARMVTTRGHNAVTMRTRSQRDHDAVRSQHGYDAITTRPQHTMVTTRSRGDHDAA